MSFGRVGLIRRRRVGAGGATGTDGMFSPAVYVEEMARDDCATRAGAL
jgi:hypothetical protein